MALGEQRFKVQEAGRKYLLSDGTEIHFLSRNESGEVEGVTAEEVLSVVAHRLDVVRSDKPANGRLLSLAVTAVQDAENWLARWDSVRRQGIKEMV